MRHAFLIALIVWLPLNDLASAALYALTGSDLVGSLRLTRDALCILVAAWGALTVNGPPAMWLSAGLYCLLVLLYVPVGTDAGVSLGTVVSSAGVLLIPFIFAYVGYFAIRTTRELKRAMLVVVCIGLLSTLFGIYDRENTSFWTDIVQLPRYLEDIKGIVHGLNPMDSLPWNFYGYNTERRAAGLLAAPLAQGSYLAVACMCAVALLSKRSTLLSLLALLFIGFGIFQSTTRGAMLMLLVAFTYFIAVSSNNLRKALQNVLFVAVGGAVVALPLYEVVFYTVNLLDDSTIGHVDALRTNLMRLSTVLVFGWGIGTEGAIAAQEGLLTVGGGEGAIFTMAFQLGLVGAVAFCWFCGAIWRLVRSAFDAPSDLGIIGRCMAALMIGAATTLVKSEHVLTVSGMATLWILLGGTARVALRERVARARMAESSAMLAADAHAYPARL